MTPNALVATIHPTRMPVILLPERYDGWLTAGPEEAFEQIKPYPAKRMGIVKSGEGEKEYAG